MKLYQIASLFAIGNGVLATRQQPSDEELQALRDRFEEFGKQLNPDAEPPRAPDHLIARQVRLDVIQSRQIENFVSEAEGETSNGRPIFSFIIEGLETDKFDPKVEYVVDGKFVGLKEGQEAVLITELATIEQLSSGRQKVVGPWTRKATVDANDYDVWRALRIGGRIYCDLDPNATLENKRCELGRPTGLWDYPGFAHIFAKNVDSWTCNRWRYLFHCDLEYSRLVCEEDVNMGMPSDLTMCRLEACLVVKDRSYIPPTPYPSSPRDTEGIDYRSAVWQYKDRKYGTAPTRYYPSLYKHSCLGFHDTTDLRVVRSGPNTLSTTTTEPFIWGDTTTTATTTHHHHHHTTDENGDRDDGGN